MIPREQAVFQKFVRGLPMTESDVLLLSRMMERPAWIARAQTEFERQRRTGGARPNPQRKGWSRAPFVTVDGTAIRQKTNAEIELDRAQRKAARKAALAARRQRRRAKPRKNPAPVAARFVTVGGKRRLVTEQEAWRVARSVGCVRSNPQSSEPKPPKREGLKYLAFDGAEERPMTAAERKEFAKLFPKIKRKPTRKSQKHRP